MMALSITDRLVPVFPSIHDVVLERLPRLDLFFIGELFFAAFLICFAVMYFRERPRDLPYLLVMLGIFYAARGVFLLLLPIGAPLDAPALADRFVLYPFANHAYFPGGHVGILFLMSRTIQHRLFHPLFITATIVFGIGTMLARAHYTADIIGGLLLAYAVEAWARRHCARMFLAPVGELNAIEH